MKVVDKLKNAEKPLFTFELLPPLKGRNIDEIYAAIDPLMEFNPAYINITYHQEEIIYKKRENGLLEKRTVKKRPGTVGIAAAIKFKYNVMVVPHIICGGFSMEETEDALIDLHFLGVHNLLALRGDPPRGSRIFTPEEGGHKYTLDLIKQIMDMNQAKYLDIEMKNAKPTSFSIGVAGYPEKHFESPNMDSDLSYLKKKIEAGAEYVVTQMFFDNSKYFNFVRLCREAGIDVPIVPGIKPISTLRDINILPQVFHVDIPQELVNNIRKCTTNQEARQAGVEWATQQSKELIEFGVPSLHYYTLGESDNIRKICMDVF